MTPRPWLRAAFAVALTTVVTALAVTAWAQVPTTNPPNNPGTVDPGPVIKKPIEQPTTTPTTTPPITPPPTPPVTGTTSTTS
ncbi:MAG: hypothetical protein ACRDY5_08720, partial [Acidimicrobiales bacterium]